jgi:hypothetical protein
LGRAIRSSVAGVAAFGGAGFGVGVGFGDALGLGVCVEGVADVAFVASAETGADDFDAFATATLDLATADCV